MIFLPPSFLLSYLVYMGQEGSGGSIEIGKDVCSLRGGCGGSDLFLGRSWSVMADHSLAVHMMFVFDSLRTKSHVLLFSFVLSFFFGGGRGLFFGEKLFFIFFIFFTLFTRMGQEMNVRCT